MADNQIRRQPPPPPPQTDDPIFKNWLQLLNRWFLDLSAFIAPGGGIDPGQLTGGAVLNGNGVPDNAIGNDGDLYLNDAGTNGVLRLGLSGEGSAVRDVSGDQLYGKITGVWSDLV